MSSKTAYLLYAVLGLAVMVWLYGRWDSDRRRIDRQLSLLQELVDKDSGESALVAANKARQVGELLTRDFEILLEPLAPMVNDRARLAQVALGYRNRSTRIRLSFSDKALEIDDRLKTGEMTLVATISGTAAGSSFREGYRLRLRWVVEEKLWRIQQIELLEVLEGLPSFL